MKINSQRFPFLFARKIKLFTQCKLSENLVHRYFRCHLYSDMVSGKDFPRTGFVVNKHTKLSLLRVTFTQRPQSIWRNWLNEKCIKRDRIIWYNYICNMHKQANQLWANWKRNLRFWANCNRLFDHRKL